MTDDRRQQLNQAGVAAIPAVTSSEPPPPPAPPSGMTDETITIRRDHAKRIHDILADIAEAWDDRDYGATLDSDDTAAARQLAEALGLDPATVTDPIQLPSFPHAFAPGETDLDKRRRLAKRTQGRFSFQTPETDAEVIARLGGPPGEVCEAGGRSDGWGETIGMCRKSAADPIHQTAEMGP
jgi:hypothetical protein